MKNGTANTKSGLTILLEAAVLVAAEKTVSALGDLQLLKVAELIVQNMLSGENKNDA
jgi:rRNA processing protein Krr1/Pno1